MLRFTVFLFCALTLCGAENKLWYSKPAGKWTEALPLGNGRLAAMLFGGVETEHLQLNEDTVWAGERRDRLNPGAAAAVIEVRKLLAAGKVREAELLADQAIISKPRRMPPYQPLGDLRIHFEGVCAGINYRRELYLESGVAKVTFKCGDVTYTREVFISAPDQVLVLHFTSSKRGALTLEATLDRERDAEAFTLSPTSIVLKGQALPVGDRYADAYFLLTPGASRADFWRYCALWRFGGVYADSKMRLLRPLDDIIRSTDELVLTKDIPDTCILN